MSPTSIFLRTEQSPLIGSHVYVAISDAASGAETKLECVVRRRVRSGVADVAGVELEYRRITPAVWRQLLAIVRDGNARAAVHTVQPPALQSAMQTLPGPWIDRPVLAPARPRAQTVMQTLSGPWMEAPVIRIAPDDRAPRAPCASRDGG